jgi:hypothetical protein
MRPLIDGGLRVIKGSIDMPNSSILTIVTWLSSIDFAGFH